MLKKIIALLAVVVFAAAGIYAYRTHKAVKNVETYRSVVESVLKEDKLPSSDEELVLAIIYQETKGGEIDVMQSSESVTGTTNTTSDTHASIRNGVSHLAEMLAYASEKDTDVWTGVQAYNFGKAYVDYIAKNGSKNTLLLADKYSKTVVAPSLGNANGETYRHLTWDALTYNGGKLYVDGGNFFYAQEVKKKMDLIRWFNW
ncbi:lysozyme family protein [Lactovum odontotermitis]